MRYIFEGVHTTAHSSELLKELRDKFSSVTGVLIQYTTGYVIVDIDDSDTTPHKTAKSISKYLNAKRFRKLDDSVIAPMGLFL